MISRKPKGEPTAQTASTPAEAPPLSRAFFRVLHVVFHHDGPPSELDALPLAQMRLLWTVYFGADATMKDFSERLGVSQSTVTQLADRLVRRGLVERHADPSDRRIVRLRASPLGRQLLSQTDDQNRRLLGAVWEAISPRERAALMRSLELLAVTAEAIRAAQGAPVKPWPSCPPDEERPEGATDAVRPVLDLMNRRVRGRKA